MPPVPPEANGELVKAFMLLSDAAALARLRTSMFSLEQPENVFCVILVSPTSAAVNFEQFSAIDVPAPTLPRITSVSRLPQFCRNELPTWPDVCKLMEETPVP